MYNQVGRFIQFNDLLKLKYRSNCQEKDDAKQKLNQKLYADFFIFPFCFILQITDLIQSG